MAAKKQDYKVTMTGPGHNFEQTIDAATASQILALVMTGAITVAPTGAAAATIVGGNPQVTSGGGAIKSMSLAAFLKSKKADKKQIERFLATAAWLTARGELPITATAVAKALSDHHQKRLANSADCLNKNVSKGLAEKRKDGSFFITPE